MHNPGELASLCGSLCLGIDGTCREKKDRILAQITHQTEINHNPEKSYAEVLHFMWEGILFEYLRANGYPMKSVANDPRIFTIIMWRKKALEQFGGAFRPHYIPKHIRLKVLPKTLDVDILAMLNGIAKKEDAVKHSEKGIKELCDFRSVSHYIAAVKEMSKYEEDCRNYLLGETELLRAYSGHQIETLDSTSVQLAEYEKRHIGMAEQWCRTIAQQEASVDCYLAMQDEMLFEKNVLALQVDDFLEKHGGREGNLMTSKKLNLNELTVRFFARYEYDMKKYADDLAAKKEELSNAKEQLEKGKETIVEARRKAEQAELYVVEWQKRHKVLQDVAAKHIAQLEIENELFKEEAALSLVESRERMRETAVARTKIERLLADPESEIEGAILAEALGIMDREEISERIEANEMGRQEFDQRASEAIRAAHEYEKQRKGKKK